MRPSTLAYVSTCAVLALTGCPGGQADAPAGGASASKTELTIKGSDTMVHLVTAWSEAYMKAHPEVQISVTGGGSGTGIAAMINGTTDVCMASREMKEKELKLAEKQGVSPERHIVARDGIAIVVHPENQIEALTMDQLRQIYNGTLTNWKQVGGADHEIQVLSRESSSGTYGFFKDHVLQKDEFGASTRLMPSTASIAQSTSQDPGSIGYVGLGYVEGGKIKLVGVQADAGAEPTTPSIETVQSGAYAISRPLNLYTKTDASQLARDFVAFSRSAEGQKIVAESGYVPLKPESTK